jgi:hypothetical protein
MANYYATSRTTLVKVRDEEKFKEWAGGIPAQLISSESAKDGTLYGFLFNQDDCGGIPNWRHVDESDEPEDMDILEEIQSHIADGWGIAFTEAGAEKHRYVHGFAAVVTSSDIKVVDLSSWVDATMKDLEVEKWA